MATALQSWERLLEALKELRRSRNAVDEELLEDELDNLEYQLLQHQTQTEALSSSLPDDLAQNEDISDVISAVTVATSLNKPKAARLLTEYAYHLARELDPQSVGRGVLQFKTSLQTLLHQSEAETVSKAKIIEDFFVAFRENLTELERGADRESLATSWKVARVLKKVIGWVQRESRVNEKVVEDIDNFAAYTETLDKEKYNIVPLEVDNDSEPVSYLPEVRNAIDFLKPPMWLPVSENGSPWRDVFHFLEFTFGFQVDNVRNQREHLVLLLANDLTIPKNKAIFSNELFSITDAVQKLFGEVFANYRKWADYVKADSLFLTNVTDPQGQLLYLALYWLIWGEAANLKFMPELLCYIFHRAGEELGNLLLKKPKAEQSVAVSDSGDRNERLGEAFKFQEKIVTPIYAVIAKEVAFSGEHSETKGHELWRNYDDLNEFFWSPKCLSLGWPLDLNHSFFTVPPQKHDGKTNVNAGEDPKISALSEELSRTGRKKRLGKTLFSEWRNFWHLYHSFERLWIFLVVMFQALTIVAFGGVNSLVTLQKVLTIFPTIAALQTLQASTDIMMSFRAFGSMQPAAVLRKFLRLLISGAFAGALTYLCYKMLLELEQSSRPYLALYSLVLVAFVAPRVVINLLLRVATLRQQTDKIEHWSFARFIKWFYEEEFYVGRGMYESTFSVFLYSLFWFVLLVAKFLFSYYFQIHPLVSPTSYIVDFANIRYRWHDLVSGGNFNLLTVASLWVPVSIIYLLDIQIWYTVLSALVGGFIGAFWHLGEIQSLSVLRARFLSFPEKFKAKLQPVTTFDRNHSMARNSATDSSGSQEVDFRRAQRFALAWNEIIRTMREEDYLSNEEEELLSMPGNPSRDSPIRWPIFLLANKVHLAMGYAKAAKTDKELKDRIYGNEYMRCAVIETFNGFRDALRWMALFRRGDTKESQLVKTIFGEIEQLLQCDKICESLDFSKISEVHKKLTALTSLLIQPQNPSLNGKVTKALQDLVEVVRTDLFKAESLKIQLASSSDSRKRGPLERPLFSTFRWPSGSLLTQIKRLHLLLTVRDSAEEIPQNLEARRRLQFFCNSLFMEMPFAPRVKNMAPFCVMTPYYSEIVAYSLEELYKKNEDGISTLFYLKTIYPDEWHNFLERIGSTEKELEQKMKAGEDMAELRMWVSYRGQTLARTVRGMMYYRRAIQLLAFLEEGSTAGDLESGQGLNLMEERDAFLSDSTRALADLKFTYVVTCQIYGKQRRDKDPRYFDIFDLMKRHPGLRIAYIDEKEVRENNVSWKEYYSCLLRVDKFGQEQEIYRIRLPGPAKLGEGKPENQNHAIIFSRGRALQTIDMNQDNYFEEALKMRNLLEEFRGENEFRKPTILGVREHVFTGSVSSLASFMSNQETSFVTLGQRVLAYPLKVRMHYGHPDVFDRIFHLTRGGISKSSKLIHISEDIFAGFNTTLRQGNVTHHEYIQVGKGRDVGLNQIALFEAKVASGNGEQTLSRDIYRLGQQFDFYRMLSFFFTSVGFYTCTLLTVLCVYSFLYGKVYLALSGVEAVLKSRADIVGNSALSAAISSQFLLQIGVFTAVPMIVVFVIENGLSQAIIGFVTMQLQLASVFFTFSLGTRSHFFSRTIVHGGAKYRSTGRGFVVRHEKFAELYRTFSRSHFTKGMEVAMLLIVYFSYGSSSSTTAYILLSISSWFMAISWCFAPYIFNPSGFEWQKTVEDFEDWKKWLFYKGGVGVKSNVSWEAWWEEEVSHVNSIRSRFWDIFLSLRFFLFQYGIVYSLNITSGNTSILVYAYSWIVALALITLFALSNVGRSWDAQLQVRFLQSSLMTGLFVALVVLLLVTPLTIGDVLASFLVFIPTGWGLLQIMIALRPFFEFVRLWKNVRSFARLFDALMGGIIFLPIAVLSWFPFISTFQSRLMFNQAFSRGLEISLILAGKKDDSK